MTLYKVLKDFPSRNGVTQYKVGQSVCLDPNSRTKALVEMGYVEEYSPDDDYVGIIKDGLMRIGRFKRVHVEPTMYAGKHKYFNIIIDEEI